MSKFIAVDLPQDGLCIRSILWPATPWPHDKLHGRLLEALGVLMGRYDVIEWSDEPTAPAPRSRDHQIQAQKCALGIRVGLTRPHSRDPLEFRARLVDLA
jgi:hypothetical protein